MTVRRGEATRKIAIRRIKNWINFLQRTLVVHDESSDLEPRRGRAMRPRV
jgi:hypothetical protein